ncbi:MAG TPA: hypothetical protein VEW67_08785 [Thermoleophilaceae bacterium]|nr:hypothetical protein [Thermoleophilaceae bacterium]
MSRVRAVRESLGPAAPARDLPFVDAAAVLAALFLAYGARAVFSSKYSFEWSAIAPFVRVALPVAVCALLLSAAALGLYGDRAAEAGVREHVAATAYAVAVTVAIGIFWGGAAPPTAPLVLTAAVCLIACQHFGRRLYWRSAG